MKKAITKAITSKYIGPTNTKGSRISATDGMGNRIIISKDTSLNTDDAHIKAINTLTDKMGWPRCDRFGGTKTGIIGLLPIS